MSVRLIAVFLLLASGVYAAPPVQLGRVSYGNQNFGSSSSGSGSGTVSGTSGTMAGFTGPTTVGTVVNSGFMADGTVSFTGITTTFITTGQAIMSSASLVSGTGGATLMAVAPFPSNAVDAQVKISQATGSARFCKSTGTCVIALIPNGMGGNGSIYAGITLANPAITASATLHIKGTGTANVGTAIITSGVMIGADRLATNAMLEVAGAVSASGASNLLGSVAIGNAAAAATALDVSGTISATSMLAPSGTSINCTAALTGAYRRTTTFNSLAYCDGTSVTWIVLTSTTTRITPSTP